jgi:GxxExxY protein
LGLRDLASAALDGPQGNRPTAEHAGIAFQRQAGIPVAYKGVQFDEGSRAEILVDRELMIEIKAVANILPGA